MQAIKKLITLYFSNVLVYVLWIKQLLEKYNGNSKVSATWRGAVDQPIMD